MGSGASGHKNPPLKAPHLPGIKIPVPHKPIPNATPPPPQVKLPSIAQQQPQKKAPPPPPPPQPKPQQPQAKPQPTPQNKGKKSMSQLINKPPQTPPQSQKALPLPPQNRLKGIKQGETVFPAATTLASIPLLQKEIQQNLEHDYMHPVLGNYLFANGNYEWFIQKWYTQMVKGSKLHFNPYDALALCLCDNLNDKKLMEKMLDWYRKIKNTMENNINSKTLDPQKKERLKNSIYQIINGYAHLLSNTGRYDMALATYRKVIELEPEFINPRACSALIYESKRINKEKAYEMSHEILKMDGRNLWALQILARKENDPNIRIQKMKQAMLIYPSVAKIASQIGMAYGGALKNCNEAIEWYKKAAEIAPGYASCYSNIGINYQMLKQYETAIDWYFKAMEQDVEYLPAYKNAIDCFHTTYMNQKMINQKLAKHPTVSPFFFKMNMGLAYYKKKKYSEAIKWLTRALAVPGGNAHHYKVANYVAAVYDDIEQYDDALLNYEKCIKLQPSFHEAYYNSAIVYQAKKDIPKAIEFYQKAIKVNPQYSYAYMNLGNLYKATGEMDKAIQSYQSAVEYNSSYTLAYANLGVCLLQVEKYPEAFDSLKRANDCLPNDNNGLSQGNRTFLTDTLDKFKKEGKVWQKQGFVSGQQKHKLENMIKSFEANFKSVYSGQSTQKLQDAKVLRPEVLQVCKLTCDHKFELEKIDQTFTHIKKLFYQNEEAFHILPQLFIRYFYIHTFQLKEPILKIEKKLIQITKRLKSTVAPVIKGQEQAEKMQVRLKKKPSNDSLNLFKGTAFFKDYQSLYAEIDKANEQAKLALPLFSNLVEKIREESEGIPSGVCLKMPANQQGQFKVLLRIMEKMFKKEITSEKVEEIIKKIDKDLTEKSQKGKVGFMNIVQSIIGVWTGQITQMLKDRKSKQIETVCDITDLVRGKIMFKSIQQLVEAVSVTEQLCEQYGYRVVMFNNRLSKAETRDAVFKIGIKDSICELQLAMKQDARDYNLTHALYELERSPLGCIFACYIYMSKRFNYPFLTNCVDIADRLQKTDDPKKKQYSKAASYIADALKQ